MCITFSLVFLFFITRFDHFAPCFTNTSLLVCGSEGLFALACEFKPSLFVTCEIVYKWLSNRLAFRCIAINQCKFTNKLF